MTSDPFAAFGLTPQATVAEVRAARRRLAFETHPDRGGDPAAMQALNAAFDACVGHLTGRHPLAPGDASTEPASGQRRRVPDRRTRMQRLEYDTPSFTIDALPAEAFEALLVVASWIGEVVDDDPPYALECLLAAPCECWCRLELVPDAGGSTVSLVVGAIADSAIIPPTAEEVRDVWVEELNRLGRQPL